ncbi:MAG: transcriptional regulator, partial [Lachnospiraceae bacterium]|nr:transcriptional regulator [Lachnospiraceae bacterium]
MTAVFLKLLNMSIAAGWLALAVMVLRLILKKAPKAIHCVMWGLVGIRLVCPFSVESIFSLIPSAETVPPEIMYEQEPTIHSGVSALNSYINPIISESLAPAASANITPVQRLVFVSTVIWIAGIMIMACYGMISYLRLRRRIGESVRFCKGPDRDSKFPAKYGNHIWVCDRISTPFILGVMRPRIFLPSDINEEDAAYVIAHECAHLKRRDHWWKPIGFVLLTIYWFNPVMWAAYILLCGDIELACDEQVIKDMGTESKKSYLETLINCSSSERMISACPLAFGEVGVERRVKNILHYKK